MRGIVLVRSLFAGLISVVDAQTVKLPYKFKVVDIRGLQDINNKADLVADLLEPDGGGVVFTQKQKLHGTQFGCNAAFDFTSPVRINNHGDIVGSCETAPGDPSNKLVGFIRDKNGHFTFLDVPGADGTEAFGINDRGAVVGQYFIPLISGASGFARFHGFLWRKGKFETIDIPLDNSVTILLGINKKQQIIGAYFTYEPVPNEVSEWHGFVYDNGNFTPLNFPGSAWAYPLDINNEGQVLGVYDTSVGGFQGGPSEPEGGHFIFDDDKFFKVGLPPVPAGSELAFFDVNGMNDEGQLVGFYTTRELCGDPEPFACNITTQGFIATPRHSLNLTSVR